MTCFKGQFLLTATVVTPLLFAATETTAQTAKRFVVKGVVADAATKEGEQYATMKITSQTDSTSTAALAVSEADGTFNMTLKKAGSYRLYVNAMGKQPIVRNFVVSDSKPVAALDTLYIKEASHVLGAVEIVAQKPLVKADIDKITYDIEEDPDSKTNNILEMLRKVPMVTVDGDSNIKVNGSSGFKVYVNGRPNNMMSKNPKEVLKSMPASSIKKIEVITNPGPKYDAEGVGGILNIVTVGKGIEGYTVTTNAGVSNTDTDASVYATVKQGKFTVSGTYSYNYYDMRNMHSDFSSLFTGDPATPSASDRYATSDSRSYNHSHSGNFEASYDVDTLRLVTASFGIWTNRSNAHSLSRSNAMSPLSGATLYSYANGGRSVSDNMYLYGNLDYQRLFKLKGRMLTFSYKINGGTNGGDNYSSYDVAEATDEWLPFVKRLSDEHTESSGRSMEHTLQVDYTTPIGKAHNVEVGAKYILRDNRSDDDRYVRQNGTDGEYTFDELYSSHYRHENDILAAYLGYGLRLGNLSGRLGARYEHTFQKIKYELGEGENFSTGFDDVVPSASLGYRINDENNLRFGYNMRIYRPGIWSLNPYLNQTNPEALQQGNPNLVSEKNHNVQLTYSYFAAKFSVSCTMRYSFTNNNISSVTSLVEDNTIESVKNPTGKLVSYTTYRNIGRTQTASLSSYVNWNIFKNTRLTMNLWGDYSDYNDRQQLHNYGYYGSAYVGVQQTLPKNWRVNLGFYGCTSNPGLQSKTEGRYNYNLNVQKSFLKDRLNFNLYASNFLDAKRHYKSTVTGANFITRSDSSYNPCSVGINVSWRIGELSSGVKKVARSISNDDVKSAEGGGK